MFRVTDRERVRDRILALASTDTRVVAGALVGSAAVDEEDRWSDLDLTFAVADGVPLHAVLSDWTGHLADEFGAIHLFDLPYASTIYRVFVLPGCLQLDLSFTPAAEFGAIGPKFKTLFGTAVDKPHVPPPPARDLFGYAVHHALRARFCIERGRYWQAEYWISAVRDYGLNLACRRRGLPAREGRGFDDLPADVHDAFRDALVTSLTRDDLPPGTGVAVRALLSEADEVRALATTLESLLRQLADTPGH
jgi:hypothetical protein